MAQIGFLSVVFKIVFLIVGKIRYYIRGRLILISFHD